MELALTLGVDPSKPFSDCMELALDLGGASAKPGELDDDDGDDEKEDEEEDKHAGTRSSSSSSDHHHHHPLQLELLPLSPVPRPHQISSQIRFPWLPSSDISGLSRLNAARATSVDEQSSPNSGGSSLMEFSLYRHAGVASGGGKRAEPSLERAEAVSDEENGSTRKKLRLSKEQSAFLEESFKEHHTLNPKQKLALAKQLSLRPRQVEVWFQNRRARTKLKQTEVDCEYLKRCCETLTEENRRLQKELHELRALKTSQPFYMQLPATTLTMCPSCERVAPTTKAAGNPQSANPKPILPFVGPPQAQSQAHPFVGPPQAQSQAHKAVS